MIVVIEVIHELVFEFYCEREFMVRETATAVNDSSFERKLTKALFTYSFVCECASLASTMCIRGTCF
jgi:hypothetical protein